MHAYLGADYAFLYEFLGQAEISCRLHRELQPDQPR